MFDGRPASRCVQVTSFSNSEEKSVGKDTVVPFLLEDKLKELGAEYQKVDTLMNVADHLTLNSYQILPMHDLVTSSSSRCASCAIEEKSKDWILLAAFPT